MRGFHNYFPTVNSLRTFDGKTVWQTPPDITPFVRGNDQQGGRDYNGQSVVPAGEFNRFVSEPQKYGFVSTFAFTATAIPQVVLAQPTTTRTFLCIQNNSALAYVTISFGTNALVNQGLILPPGAPGGNLYMDAFVAQDDVYVVATGNANIIVSYSNKGYELNNASDIVS